MWLQGVLVLHRISLENGSVAEQSSRSPFCTIARAFA